MAVTERNNPKIVVIKNIRTPGAAIWKNQIDYEFFLGRRGSIPKDRYRDGKTLACIKRLPKIFRELEMAAKWSEHGASFAKIGEINYSVSTRQAGKVATTCDYEFHDLLKFPVKRMGYYLDSISAHDIMKSEAVVFISTSDYPSPSRECQLEHVGLPLAQEGASVWRARRYLLAMGKGTRERATLVHMGLEKEGIM